jgi:hypothetical protein
MSRYEALKASQTLLALVSMYNTQGLQAKLGHEELRETNQRGDGVAKAYLFFGVWRADGSVEGEM